VDAVLVSKIKRVAGLFGCEGSLLGRLCLNFYRRKMKNVLFVLFFVVGYYAMHHRFCVCALT